jgi:uncharacterized protein YjbI with pentapeptide repeats
MYLHVHLQKLWDALGSLPVIFPNGMRLEERVSPWLLSNIAGTRISKAKPSIRRFVWVEALLSEVVTWWFIPLTIAAFWLRYLSRHDWKGTTLHVALLIISIVVALVFRAAAYSAVAGRGAAGAPRRETLRLIVVGVVATIVATGFSAAVLRNPRFEVYGATFFPDLRGAHLSGENLRGVDLRQAHATGVVLDGADVRDAHLEGMHLGQSNLRAADLRNSSLANTTLVGADLRDAQLQEATLTGARLQGAKLSEKTDLQGAHLEGADLRGVDLKKGTLAGVYLSSETLVDPDGLRGTKLAGAILKSIVLTKLDLRRADFTGADLELARFVEIRGGKKTTFASASLRKATFVRGMLKKSIFEGAKLQDAVFDGCLLPEVIFKDAELQRVTFKEANLAEASFVRARLDGARFQQGTDVKTADFEGARLPGADLTAAVNLTQEQLDKACGDARTLLPVRAVALTVKACDVSR